MQIWHPCDLTSNQSLYIVSRHPEQSQWPRRSTNIFKNMDDTLPRLNIFKLKTVSGSWPLIPYRIEELYEGILYPVLGLCNMLDYFVS